MDAKPCSKCKEVKALSEFNTRPDRPSGYRSECKSCQYKAHYKREKENRQKIKAKEKANKAQKRGRLQPPLFCEGCFEDKPLDKHHPDYRKPLKVIWLCRKCHGKFMYNKCAV
jgi:hypothetical protein